MSRVFRYPTRALGLQRAQTAAIAAQEVRAASDASVVAETVANIEGLGDTLVQVNEALGQVEQALVTVDSTLENYGHRIQQLEDR